VAGVLQRNNGLELPHTSKQPTSRTRIKLTWRMESPSRWHSRSTSCSVPAPPLSGAGRMLGRQDAGAGAGLEPASEPEPLPAAGRAAPEHCCRGDRSSGYWVPPLTFQVFFYGRGLSSRPEMATYNPAFTNCTSWSLTCFRVAPCLSFFTSRAWSDLAAFPCRRTATSDTRKHLIPHSRW
jgi:hypothetical protein